MKEFSDCLLRENFKANPKLNSVNAEGFPSPESLKKGLILDSQINLNVESARRAIQEILDGQDSRLLVVVGPCSIHDSVGALEYAKRLKVLADRLSDRIFIVMRVYLEKPRTTVGWRGFIHDPDLSVAGEADIQKGLTSGRELLLKINQLGLPVAMEFLDPLISEYLSDLVSWGAVGARTAESQTHREMASGLPMPIGFKNGTSGNVQIAVDAVYSALHSHHFLGINSAGLISKIKTAGNLYGHIVLRGSHENGPNYGKLSIDDAIQKLKKLGLRPRVMIDCSHGNSEKNHQKQLEVIESLAKRLPTEKAIFGLMIESYLKPGSQKLDQGSLKTRETLEYGVSITDACIGWEDTVKSLEILAAASKPGIGII
jgi:3-deoxy-7-phosphoheptulonate synthase